MDGENLQKVLDRSIAVYLLVSAGLLFCGRKQILNWEQLAFVHVLFAAFILIVLPRLQHPLPAVLKFLRDWYPMFLLSPLYKEVETLARAVGDWRLTETIQKLDVALFGADWSVELSQRIPSVALSEYLHFCYFAYVLLIPVVGGLWYFKGKLEAFRELILLVVLTCLTSYLFYALYPVDSPFYLLEPLGEPFAGNFFFDLVHWVSSRGGARGGAFPSSHVSISTMVFLVAWRWDRRIAYVLLPIVLGIAVATVFGRFHYVLDVFAGFSWAGIIYMGYLLIRRRQVLKMDRPALQP